MKASKLKMTRVLPLAITLLLVACAGREERAADAQDEARPVAAAQQVLQQPENGRADTAAKQHNESAHGPADADMPLAAVGMRARAEVNPQSVAAPGGMAAPAYSMISPWPYENVDRENYAAISANPVNVAAQNPVSTLSIDVDTGAYANTRRFLNSNRLPPQDAVRVEELVNYFSYEFPLPEAGGPPFAVATELAPTPWNPDTLLMQVGIRGFEVPAAKRAPANLVFLIDVSGSMQSPDKLPLLKDAFAMLTGELNARDRISMVVYAGASGVVLEAAPGDSTRKISEALERLRSGGSTNGAAGIRLAYQVARANYIDGGINRVILATDGDFNVGTVNFGSLLDLAERNRETGVSLTTLGFGTGNYNDHLMEQLADAGNGNYGYIDSLNEARKLLVTEMSSTLQTIAKDVKIQIEFNPALVAEYRLVGYENRLLTREEFANDKVDAGEIGAGHTITALYEITFTGSDARRIRPLRYPAASVAPDGANQTELAFLRLRYKAPGGAVSQLIEYPVLAASERAAAATSDDFRFAAAVAAFGQKLRGSVYIGDYGYGSIAALASQARGADRFGYRREFLGLVDRAAVLTDAETPVKVSVR